MKNYLRAKKDEIATNLKLEGATLIEFNYLVLAYENSEAILIEAEGICKNPKAVAAFKIYKAFKESHIDIPTADGRRGVMRHLDNW